MAHKSKGGLAKCAVEEAMQISRRLMLVAGGLAGLLGTAPVLGAQEGTAEEAKAMLAQAVAAVKTNETVALAAFNSGANGFRDRDLYVFCARRDGTVDAHIDPKQIGRKLQDQYDKVGVAFGLEIMAVAEEGQIRAVAYMWPRPESLTPVHKVTYVTRVAGHVCGVGYYQ
jgi:signal transduction histidine kinase